MRLQPPLPGFSKGVPRGSPTLEGDEGWPSVQMLDELIAWGIDRASLNQDLYQMDPYTFGDPEDRLLLFVLSETY